MVFTFLLARYECTNYMYISLNRNSFANLSKLRTLPFYSRVNSNPFLPHTHICSKEHYTNETSVVCRLTCEITVLLYLDQSLHLLMQVAEQHVMCDTGLKRNFFEALICLGIEISPGIRCEQFNGLLRKIYNISCNEFVRSQKCLEEHDDNKHKTDKLCCDIGLRQLSNGLITWREAAKANRYMLPTSMKTCPQCPCVGAFLLDYCGWTYDFFI